MTMSMAQCVMISGIFLMLEWCADSWDSIQVVSYHIFPVDLDVSDKISCYKIVVTSAVFQWLFYLYITSPNAQCCFCRCCATSRLWRWEW